MMLKVVRGSVVLGGLLALYALSPVLAWVVLLTGCVAALFLRQQRHGRHDTEKASQA